MKQPFSLINLGDFSEAANTLVVKISDAIGGIFKPFQIKRIAKAESEADMMRTVAQIEIDELQRRAMIRFFNEEAIKQENMEAIIKEALPDVLEQANPTQIEDDWITHFFDKRRLISDKEMQALWSRILSGQANAPGKFSKGTIEILSNLERKDAILFSKLCGFCFKIGRFVPLVYDHRDAIYKDQGLNFMTLSHLESIGLIHFNSISGFSHTDSRKKGSVEYFGKETLIEFKKEKNNELRIGSVLLTQAGKEMYPICNPQPIEEFIPYIIDKWKSFGLEISLVIN